MKYSVLDRYISGWLGLIDSITRILTFGFWSTDLDWKYTLWAFDRMAKSAQMRSFTKEENEKFAALKEKNFKKLQIR